MSNLRIEENVGIHTVAGRTLSVDIFHPENPTGPVPSLLFLPGGGWRTADRAPLKERFGLRMAEQGYLFVAGEYRGPRSRDRPLYLLVTSAIGGRLHIKPFKINVLIFFNILSYMIINH